MSLETEGSSGEVSESTAATELAATETKPSTGYSMVDPGYDAFEADSDISAKDELAQLRAENTKKKPSETSDDAGDTEGEAEEASETTPDDSADPDDGFSDELLDKAVALGYTLDDIKGFSDAKALEKELGIAERVQKRLQGKAGDKSADDKASKKLEEPAEPDWDKLIELGHDPDIVALQKQGWQQIAETRRQTQQLLDMERQRAFAAQCDRFDAALDSMEGFEELLGKGRHDEIQKTSKMQASNRREVFAKMNLLRMGYEQAGKPVPPESELIQEAVHASFFKHATQTARNKLKSDIKSAGSQALSRPRSASAKPLSGNARAQAKEDAFWRKHS